MNPSIEPSSKNHRFTGGVFMSLCLVFFQITIRGCSIAALRRSSFRYSSKIFWRCWRGFYECQISIIFVKIFICFTRVSIPIKIGITKRWTIRNCKDIEIKFSKIDTETKICRNINHNIKQPYIFKFRNTEELATN